MKNTSRYPDPVNLDLPAALKPLLPHARWERVGVGRSQASVYRSTRFFLKVQNKGPFNTLFGEKERLRWLAGRVPVPRVVAYHLEGGTEYLATERVRGLGMSAPEMKLHARRNAELLARALRELHALPIGDCPFDASLNARLREARERLRLNLVNETDFGPERTGADVFAGLVRTRPASEDVVVIHGDPCLPNVIVQGEFVSGLVDVGRAGIADRHADLALAARSLAYNYGPGLDDVFLDTYGRALVDGDKLAYYRMLDELF